MMHFSCDCCGKDLPGSRARYAVRMDAFLAADPAGLTETDTDPDPVEAMAQLLAELEESGEVSPPPVGQKLAFDLCGSCYRKFLADPLGRESATKFQFSKN